MPALQAGLCLRRRGNWQRQAGTAATGGSPRSPPCQGSVGGLAGCGSLSPRLLAGHGPPWDLPSLLLPLQMVLALPRPLLTGAHRCLTGLGGSHPAGSSILSLCPSSTRHPMPAGLTAAPIGVPRRGHGCGPRAEAGAMVPPSRACGSRGDPGRGLTPAPSHSGSSPTAAPPAPGPLPPLPGDTAGAGGDSSGVVPSTQRISTLGAAASWGWGHMGTLVGGGGDSRVTKAWGRGGVHWLQGFSMLGRQRAPAAVPGDIGDNLWSPLLAPQGGGVTPS